MAHANTHNLTHHLPLSPAHTAGRHTGKIRHGEQLPALALMLLVFAILITLSYLLTAPGTAPTNTMPWTPFEPFAPAYPFHP